MSKEEKKHDDLFEEARLSSINKLIDKSKADSLPADKKNEVLQRSREELEEGETQWGLLKRMIDGSFTERFIDVMHAMPDKDFSRNYLKLLEHFKPKITRTEGNDAADNNNTIVIQAVVINEKGEQETISIEDIYDKKEDL